PYRHAVVTAKMVSSLDALSGGRVVLGIGAGWMAEESAMLSVPFKERGAMTDEYLEAMRELWTSAKPSFSGKYRQFSDVLVEPRRASAGRRAAGADRADPRAGRVRRRGAGAGVPGRRRPRARRPDGDLRRARAAGARLSA